MILMGCVILRVPGKYQIRQSVCLLANICTRQYLVINTYTGYLTQWFRVFLDLV